MTHYYNIETNEYPRHIGDLELLGWKVGEPLPKNWVEVNDLDSLNYDVDNEIVELLLPKNIEGEWHTQILVRPMTIEEKENHEKSKQIHKIEIDYSTIEVLDISNEQTKL